MNLVVSIEDIHGNIWKTTHYVSELFLSMLAEDPKGFIKNELGRMVEQVTGELFDERNGKESK